MDDLTRCRNHPRRKAEVIHKSQDAPMVSLCWECYLQVVTPEVAQPSEVEDHVESAGA